MRGAYLPTPHAHGKEKENHGRDRGGVGYLPPPHAHGKENHGRERGGTFPPLHTHERRNMDAKGGAVERTPSAHTERRTMDAKGGGGEGGDLLLILFIS